MEAQTVIVTAAGFWFGVARLGDWHRQAEIPQEAQVIAAGSSGTGPRKAKRMLGKSKVH